MGLTEQKFKVSKIGLIPNDWDVKAIGDDIDLLTGYPFHSKNYVDSGIRLLRGSNIKRGTTFWSEDITKYWEKLTPDLKPYILMEGDIVVAMDGSLVGKSFARLTKNDLPALLLQRVARIRSNKIDLGYLKEFICSEHFTKHCESVKTVSAIPHISPKDIRNFVIPIPTTKTEQTAIAIALSDTDVLIENLEKLITKKRNIKQGAMQELLKPRDNWELKTYGEVFNFLTTATYPRAELRENEEVGYIHYGDIHTKLNFFLDADTFDFPTINSQQAKNYHHLRDGDIIIVDASEDYVGVGKSVEVKNIKSKKVISGLHTFLLRDEKKILVDGFRGYLHASSFIKKQFDTLATGLKVYGVSRSNLKKVLILIPSKGEQQIIADTLIDMDFEIEALEKKLHKYRMIKQGMMQVLLTGKIRLL